MATKGKEMLLLVLWDQFEGVYKENKGKKGE